MKRTKHINLDMMRKGSKKRHLLRPLALGIVAVTMTACGSQEEVKVVSSAEDCASRTELNLEECEAAYQKAQDEAERTGPKYTSIAQCEAEFGRGQCTGSRRGSGIFMPMMTGFMVGQMLSGNNNYGGAGYNPVYRYNNPSSAQHNRMMTADGKIIGKSGQGSYRVSKSSMKSKPTATRTISRGGFGAVASAKSSWGGGRSSGWGG